MFLYINPLLTRSVFLKKKKQTFFFFQNINSCTYMFVRISPSSYQLYVVYVIGFRFVFVFLLITKTCLYNFKPHFYIVKMGFTEVYIIFFFLLINIDCVYSLEPPRWGGSNEYLQSLFWAEIWNYQIFLSENFHFLEVKFSIYLNRRVFVMMY